MNSSSNTQSVNILRSYKARDFDNVVDLLKSNIPEFFAPSEIEDFKNYLLHSREDYFVLEREDRIIAAGGINYLPDEDLARLAWDMVHNDFHKKGFGAILLNHRINHIKTFTSFTSVDVRSSQFAFKFYQKHDFRLVCQEKDFWGAGFDLYHLIQSNIK
jgi:N-acetylglutamate synthase-like GNAT family acetyltransferase